MLFNSFHYLFFLLVVLFVVESVRHRNFLHTFLLIASYYFYWTSTSGVYVALLVASTYLDFFCGRAIHQSADPARKRFYLLLSLLGNLGTLGYFKYTNFAIDAVQGFSEAFGWHPELRHLEIYLPIGISFYTFIKLGYILDVYWGKLIPALSFKKFAIFIAFFPHLVAGPILRARDFLPQLERPVCITWDNLRIGLTLVVYGLIKKVCIADNLSGFVKETFTGELTNDSVVVILASIAFAIQIYCDFSGYTDIAIGSAKILGFTFPENFNHPYFSPNITEFWRRWHMTLSSWLRDYLYIPLGGNRMGKARQCLNLLVTLVLAGLWHGAAWNFLFWGFYHGLLLVGHKLMLAERRIMSGRVWDPFKIAFTFWLTCIGWIIFLIPDPAKLVFYLKKMLLLGFSTPELGAFVHSHGLVLFVMVLFFLFHAISYWLDGLSRVFVALRVPAWATCMFSGIVTLYFLGAGQQQSFIYFQF